MFLFFFYNKCDILRLSLRLQRIITAAAATITNANKTLRKRNTNIHTNRDTLKRAMCANDHNSSKCRFDCDFPGVLFPAPSASHTHQHLFQKSELRFWFCCTFSAPHSSISPPLLLSSACIFLFSHRPPWNYIKFANNTSLFAYHFVRLRAYELKSHSHSFIHSLSYLLAWVQLHKRMEAILVCVCVFFYSVTLKKTKTKAPHLKSHEPK